MPDIQSYIQLQPDVIMSYMYIATGNKIVFEHDKYITMHVASKKHFFDIFQNYSKILKECIFFTDSG